MQFSPFEPERSPGFTLIELSIVLVIIGLIIGSVLVGRDLINSAAVRAQIAQIEKYNTAVNTFRGKYGYLPGDIPDPTAQQYGFTARGSNPGQGDGNGILQGYTGNVRYPTTGTSPLCDETGLFWTDLSKAGLIDFQGQISLNDCQDIPSVAGTAIATYLPSAKLGSNNYIYVWSGGWSLSDSMNYFGLSNISNSPFSGNLSTTNMAVTVNQAYAIDTKVDDGLPQSGRVTALLLNMPPVWAAGGGGSGDKSSSGRAPVTSAGDIGDGTPQGPNSCYDGNSGLPEKYSMEENNGAGLNCALSFRFQ